MTKKKKHGAILAIDPSFRGMGIAFYSGNFEFCFRERYDICQDYKGFSKYAIIVKLAFDFIERLFEQLDPFIWDTTVLVVESQFKTALERLQDAVVNQIYSKLEGKLKIIPVAAYTWREYYLLTGKNYNQRKKLSVEFVTDNPQLICWEAGLKDDNICEAIILLNFALGKYSLDLEYPMDYTGDDYQEYAHSCPVCNYPCTVKVVATQTAKNYGKQYWACGNGGCTKKGFVCLVGEENQPPNYLRKRGPQRQQQAPPPAPKRRIQPPPPQQHQVIVAQTNPPPMPQQQNPILKALADIEKNRQEQWDDLLSEVATIVICLKTLVGQAPPSYEEGGTDYPESQKRTDFYTNEKLSQDK